jgi:glycerol-3-phosphate dehydrogenase (NAD(P)+)
MKKIVLIGNGQIGHAISHLLTDKGHEIVVWDKDHTKNLSGKTLDQVLPDADFCFLCVPSWYMEDALSEISLYLDPKTILISPAKGINAVSHQTMDELIENELPDNQYALMCGPMLAAEIMSDQRSSAVIASKKRGTFDDIAGLFEGSNIYLEYCEEVRSVALASVLKNVYTLLIGMSDGIGEGDNTKGLLMTKSIDEILAILDIAKADISTGLGIAGLGDFIATASSPHSQNRSAGEEIAKNGSVKFRSEGLVSLASILKIVSAKKKTLPLLSILEKVVIDNKPAKAEIVNYFK